MTQRLRLVPLALAALLALVAAPVSLASESAAGRALVRAASASPAAVALQNAGLSKIDHVVIIMQENRSFDSFFGTYPGADGIPMNHGVPTTCAPDPGNGGCVRPFHNPADKNYGGPHNHSTFLSNLGGGWIAPAQQRGLCVPQMPGCTTDVMGYHDRTEIPNYWAYADNFVLHDHMFEPVSSYSLPSHQYLVSGWSARCTSTDAMSCVNSLEKSPKPQSGAPYAWTDITYLLHRFGVSWGYYVVTGSEPGCITEENPCPTRAAKTPSNRIFNPLTNFVTVQQNAQTGNIKGIDEFRRSLVQGTLPSVSWIVPNFWVSDHPSAWLSDGTAWTTSLVNDVMRSSSWGSTAIFVVWDDWGGFYDHYAPPSIGDGNGYGFRVPSLLISPYARRGYIDHQTLSFDAYLKLIEDRFLGGQRIDPATDGRPDRRLVVRENDPQLGDLVQGFDFTQAPRAPLLLPLRPTGRLGLGGFLAEQRAKGLKPKLPRVKDVGDDDVGSDAN